MDKRTQLLNVFSWLKDLHHVYGELFSILQDGEDLPQVWIDDLYEMVRNITQEHIHNQQIWLFEDMTKKIASMQDFESNEKIKEEKMLDDLLWKIV